MKKALDAALLVAPRLYQPRWRSVGVVEHLFPATHIPLDRSALGMSDSGDDTSRVQLFELHAVSPESRCGLQRRKSCDEVPAKELTMAELLRKMLQQQGVSLFHFLVENAQAATTLLRLDSLQEEHPSEFGAAGGLTDNDELLLHVQGEEQRLTIAEQSPIEHQFVGQ